MKSTLLMIGVLTAAAVAAEPDPGQAAAYQSSVSQDQLRATTERLKAEMQALIEEYSPFPAAAAEVAALKQTVAMLDNVTTKDMPNVINALREASRTADEAQQNRYLGEASGGQKSIQVALRAMADKLSRQAAQTDMQKRLENLAVRQRINRQETGYLAAQRVQPQIKQEVWTMAYQKAKEEQVALGQEIRVASEALRDINKAADPEISKPLKAAAAMAGGQNLDANSQQAATTMDQERQLEISAAKQVEVLTSLKNIISVLDSAKTAEEGLRDMAADINDLGRKELALASLTLRISRMGQLQASRGQLEVAARLELIMNRLAKHNDVLAKRAASIITIANEISQTLKMEDFKADLARVSATSDKQSALAANLLDMAQILMKLSEGVPVEITESNLSKEETALNDAIEKLAEAQKSFEAAGQDNKDGHNPKENIEEGKKAVEEARNAMANAGDSVDQKALNDKLDKSQENSSKASDGKEIVHNLYHAKGNAKSVMDALQQKASEMAAARDEKAQSMAENNEGKGESPGEKSESPGGKSGEGDGPMPGQGSGIGEAPGGPALNRVSAEGLASDAQREAVSTLSQEKVAPDYEDRVKQYVKSLSENSEGF